jgi:hypothetical protein
VSSADRADVLDMSHPPINYVMTDEDRRGLASSFALPLECIPTHLTGGEIDVEHQGVTFFEMLRGDRIAFFYAGRPSLAAAVQAALAAKAA